MTPDCISAGLDCLELSSSSVSARIGSRGNINPYEEYQTLNLDYASISSSSSSSVVEAMFGLSAGVSSSSLIPSSAVAAPGAGAVGSTRFTMMEDAILIPVAVEHPVLPKSGKKRPTTGSKRKKSVVRVTDLAPVECCVCNVTCTSYDPYMLQMDDKNYHPNCLRCTACQKCLDSERSCWVKNAGIYCKQDYIGLFGMRCSKCCRAIAATDWVRKAKASVYHLACFACDTCKRQLSTGEEFTLATIEGDIHLLCKSHYIDTQDGSSGKNKDDSDNSSTSSNGKPKTKRMRTTFTDEQLQVLQANFNLDSNPDGQDLERIAQMTGLSKRVTQVWFQNSRARQKKHQQQSQRKLNGGGGRQNCQSLEKNSSCAVSSRMMEEARQTDCLSVCSGGKSAALQSDIHHHHLMEQSLSPQSSCGDNIDSGSQFSSSFL